MPRKRPGFSLSPSDFAPQGSTSNTGGLSGGAPGMRTAAGPSSFAVFTDFVDLTGNLSFEGKAVISASGVDFSNGKSYSITMKEMEVLEVL
ncbi:MAP kinase kinase Wis1, partial [Coemansia sp. S155-1]